MINEKLLVFFIFIIFLIELVSAAPQINVVSPSTSPFYTTTNSIEINISISEQNLDSLIYNWNSTNYTMYDPSLVLMLNFDNRSSLGENSTYVVDSSKYGNNGTSLLGASLTSGKYSSALALDGKDDYVDLASSSALQLKNFYTISLWIKPNIVATSHSSSYQRIIRTNDDNQVLFFRTSTGNLEHKGVITGSSEVRTYANWNNFSVGQWSYITAVANLTNRYLYVNGRLVGSSSYSAGSAFTGTFDWELGDSSGLYSFNGTVDEVRIWNRTLSSDEVYQQYISNLQKFNQTQWYLYVNQSKNATAGLDHGTYTYQAFATDNSVNANSTELRTIIIQSFSTCPSTPQNWNVNMVDNLVINSLCNLTGYNLTFYGSGGFTLNNTLYVNEIKNLSSGMTMWVKPNGVVYTGVK